MWFRSRCPKDKEFQEFCHASWEESPTQWDLLWSSGPQLVLRCYFNSFCVDLECTMPIARGTLDPGKEWLASKPAAGQPLPGAALLPALPPPGRPPSCREGSWLLAGQSPALLPSCSPALWSPCSGLTRGVDLGTRVFSRSAFIAAAGPSALVTWLIVVIKFQRDEVCTLARKLRRQISSSMISCGSAGQPVTFCPWSESRVGAGSGAEL